VALPKSPATELNTTQLARPQRRIAQDRQEVITSEVDLDKILVIRY
jgi:hypothetical protein